MLPRNSKLQAARPSARQPGRLPDTCQAGRLPGCHGNYLLSAATPSDVATRSTCIDRRDAMFREAAECSIASIIWLSFSFWLSFFLLVAITSNIIPPGYCIPRRIQYQ